MGYRFTAKNEVQEIFFNRVRGLLGIYCSQLLFLGSYFFIFFYEITSEENMHISPNKKKEEYRKDPLADVISRLQKFVREHRSGVIGVITVIVLVGIGMFSYRAIKSTTMKNAQESFGTAMFVARTFGVDSASYELESIVNNYSNTSYAGYSAFLLAKNRMSDGEYSAALEWLSVASGKLPDNTFIKGAVFEAEGVCYEYMDDQPQARRSFEKAREYQAYAHRKNAVAWKMACLEADGGNYQEALQLCRSIIADTLHTKYHQNAGNLVAEITQKSK